MFKVIKTIVKFFFAFAFAILLAFFIKLYFLEAYNVPTDSMRPTIESGDFIFINKYIYGDFENKFFKVPTLISRKPEKKDVVVFKIFHPDSLRGKTLIKRIYAKSGDKLSLYDKYILINEKKDDSAIEEKYFFNYNLLKKEFKQILQKGIRIPKKGEYVVLDLENLFLYENLIKSEEKTVEIKNSKIYVDGIETKLYPIKHNCYFLIGDNIEVSYDSRAFGLIPEKDIIGKAIIVYFSMNNSFATSDFFSFFSSIRFSRIGNIIN